MATIQEQIDAIMAEAKKKTSQLRAKEELIEARKLQALIKGNRSKDTRQKILAGALILDMMEKDEETRNSFMARLDKFLTKDNDRALFGLPVTAPVAPKTNNGTGQ